MGEAHDPPPLAQSRGQGLAERNPHVLDRMVEINVSIPVSLEIDSHPGMRGEYRQHVAKEPVWDLDSPLAAIKAQRQPNPRLPRRPLHPPHSLLSPSPGEGGREGAGEGAGG